LSKLFCIAFLTLAIVKAVVAQPLDTAYHNNAEIITELRAYAERYPDWMIIDSIGHSAEFNHPIWMAKLSDNPRRVEPQAALLFVGQVHAEEVIGVELALQIMRTMLENNAENIFRQRLEGLEIYIIPTANPDGLDIVHSGQDDTYRKNCRDNIGDGRLRIQSGEGWDTSGVDLNRNFGTHWDRGDTLFHPEVNARYNGFRGAAPFSEPEAQALRDLALNRQFLYSIVYHSSRSGANRQYLIGPWYWTENGIVKRPPDAPAINALGETLADLMPVQNFDSTYWYGQSMQRKGQLQDWFYIETGCIQYMAEIGAEIHPNAETMRRIVNDQIQAAWFLMDLALGLEGLDGYGTLTVNITDSETGRPFSAIIEIDGRTHPILTPRRSNPRTGRCDWLLSAGEHSIRIKKPGWESQTFNDYRIPDSERTVLEVELQKLPEVRRFITLAGNALQEASLKIFTDEGELFQNAYLTLMPTVFTLYTSRFDLLLTADGFLPSLCSINVTENWEGLELDAPPADIYHSEDFSTDRGWQRQGNGWGIVTFDGRQCLTESSTGDYPTNADIWLELSDVALLDTLRSVMRIVHLPYCEPQDDYQEIAWWTNPDDVHNKRFSQLRKDWDTLYISLDNLDRGMLNIRFRVVSDAAIGEDGWLIDDITVFVEDTTLSDCPPLSLIPHPLSLHCFPNPFNSRATITFDLSVPSVESVVNLRIFDPLGRLVQDLTPKGWMGAGKYIAVWNAKSIPAGCYYLKMKYISAEGNIKAVKTIPLLKF